MAGNDPLPLPEFTENLTLVRKDENAKQRLAELSGLTLDVFEEALFSGHSGSARSTGSHAKNAAGTYRWHETLAALRSALTSQQWEQRDEKNAPRIVSPDGKIALMVATGNAKTGTKDNPSNATSKGIMTQLDVWNNDESQQMVIEEIAKLISSTSPKTWMLLYSIARGITIFAQNFLNLLRCRVGSLQSGRSALFCLLLNSALQICSVTLNRMKLQK